MNLEPLIATGQRFGTIYADPPWPYKDDPPHVAAKDEYALMTVAAISALPVAQLALPQAHLHLWVTNAFLAEGLAVLKAWEFDYTMNFIWGKTVPRKAARPVLGRG